MKIIIAPDSFKGCLNALEVAQSIEKGIRKVYSKASMVTVPMADGGEGTVQSLVGGTKGQLLDLEVTGPLGQKVKAQYGVLGDKKTAVIEMASASGLPLVPENKRNPMITTTYGTGELIKAALERGCKKIIVGIGGSATCDGGAGMIQALGVKLLDGEGKEIGFGGGALKNLRKIDISGLDERIKSAEFLIACDVNNPLLGSNGAAYVYGPQKGATPVMAKELDGNLENFANIIKLELGKDIKYLPGAGAAGGLGAGFLAFLNAKLKPGIEIVAKFLDLEYILKDANLVITGEGKIDKQSIFGKTPVGVAKLAKKYDLPVVAVCGSLGEGWEQTLKHGIDAIFSICDSPMTLRKCMTKTPELLVQTIENIFRTIKIGKEINKRKLTSSSS